jgi:Protein of unknown function (DUF3040)
MVLPRILGISPLRFTSRIGYPAAGLSLGGAVPLSEHEQRMLDQIEQALYAEDPKFAHAVRSTNPQVHFKRRIVKAALGFVVGVCALMAGLVVNQGTVTIAISVTGFLLMVVCCVWALTSWKRMTGVGSEATQDQPQGGRRQSRPAKAGFMERMEERWRRRTEGD